MKKAIIILLIISMVCLVATTVILSIAFRDIEFHYHTIEEEKQIAISETIKEIEIESAYVETIRIIETEEDEIFVKLKGSYEALSKNATKIEVEEKSSKIKIKITDRDVFRFFEWNISDVVKRENTLDLEIYVPKKYEEEIVVKAGTEKLEIEDLNLSRLKLNIGSERVNLSNLDVTRLEISGAINKLNIKDHIGGIIIEGASSDIDLHYKEFNRDLTINGAIAELIISLPKDSDYEVERDGITSIEYFVDGVEKTFIDKNGINKIEINGIATDIVIKEY